MGAGRLLTLGLGLGETTRYLLTLGLGSGEAAPVGTELIYTDRTSTGDGVSLSADRDVSFTFDAADSTGGGIA